MGKWSFQLRGRKRWRLRASVPTVMTHLGDLEFIVEPGELLFFLPDHEHGTMCVPAEPVDGKGVNDEDHECLSLHGYISLPYDGNCYLQRMMNLGYVQHLQRVHRQQQQNGESPSSPSSSSATPPTPSQSSTSSSPSSSPLSTISSSSTDPQQAPATISEQPLAQKLPDQIPPSSDAVMDGNTGFVRYARTADRERARYDAPSDYFYRCPPSYHHRTVQCVNRHAQQKQQPHQHNQVEEQQQQQVAPSSSPAKNEEL